MPRETGGAQLVTAAYVSVRAAAAVRVSRPAVTCQVAGEDSTATTAHAWARCARSARSVHDGTDAGSRRRRTVGEACAI
ncbi:MAG: hypothetical protein QOG01_972 [Pseudonocardiales bacterium]|jgi:hypothetical protein|nr:hypothetical protein [Pseudonocardiales bacterium]